jgi:hypothetical protein
MVKILFLFACLSLLLFHALPAHADAGLLPKDCDSHSVVGESEEALSDRDESQVCDPNYLVEMGLDKAQNASAGKITDQKSKLLKERTLQQGEAGSPRSSSAE